MPIQIRKRAHVALKRLTELEVQDVADKLDELDKMPKPLQQTQSIYPFAATGGQWWVRKIFDLKLRIFFSIDPNGDIRLMWVDHREDETYDEAEQEWKLG